ncbi:hypothetical protein MKW92_051632 [Papaver armeniacum]|nr:hypothetical protein MKW92_051632 [Papaver armeniacum]
MRLKDKVAIITGAASGIGEATARLFVENGAFVVIADIQDELGDQVVSSIGPDKACYIHCDVTDEKQVEEAVAYALDKYGTLDIVYSNAGIIGSMRPILDIDMKELENMIAINVCGGAAMIKHAGRAMVARNIRGSIICTASATAIRGGIGPSDYTTSKHAVLGLVHSASYELGMYGIRVNCVSPITVATPLTCKLPVFKSFSLDPELIEAFASATLNLKGMVLKAKDVADAALFLASEESCCINGHNIVIDGGLTSNSNIYPIDYSTLIIPFLRWSVKRCISKCFSIFAVCRSYLFN